MSDDLRGQVYKNIALKETDELLDIWQTNDRAEWTDSTFEAIEEILKKRIGSVPPQGEPILESSDEEIIEEDDDNLEGWESKLLDREDQPDFYDVLEVLSLKDNINKTAKAAIWVNIILAIVTFGSFQRILLGVFPSLDDLPGILWSLFVTVFVIGLNIAVIYFPLKALAHILRILMEMEFNSRKAK
jgi:hypothetical protein